MNVLIVKPLVDRLYDEDDISVGEYTKLSLRPLLTGVSVLSAGQPYAVPAGTAISTAPSNR